MAEEKLDFLDRHPLLDQIAREGPAVPVRVDLLHSGRLDGLSQNLLDPADPEAGDGPGTITGSSRDNGGGILIQGSGRVVMKSGEIQQIGTPIDIYNEPKNAYVADFIGESNIIPGTMTKDYEVTFGGRTFECVDPLFKEMKEGAGNMVDVVIRPEDIYVKEESDKHINGTCTGIVFKGVHYEITVIGDNGVEWMIHDVDPVKVGQRVGLTFDPDDIQIMRRTTDSQNYYCYGALTGDPVKEREEEEKE